MTCNSRSSSSSSSEIHKMYVLKLRLSSARVTRRKGGRSRRSGDTMGWLKQTSNESCCEEVDHIPPTIGWLQALRNGGFCRKAGHTNPEMGWLKLSPNNSC